jgi:hypothetical protein
MQKALTMPAGAVERARAVVVTPAPEGRRLTVSFDFDAGTLPFLQLWHDLRPRSSLFAVEPCTSARTEDGHSMAESPLGPGEARQYDVAVAIAGEAAAVSLDGLGRG